MGVITEEHVAKARLCGACYDGLSMARPGTLIDAMSQEHLEWCENVGIWDFDECSEEVADVVISLLASIPLVLFSGDGFGFGSGYGDGFGDGDGFGVGDGDGYGYGYGDGDGSGFGYGYGYGYGSGYGDGFGDCLTR